MHGANFDDDNSPRSHRFDIQQDLNGAVNMSPSLLPLRSNEVKPLVQSVAVKATGSCDKLLSSFYHIFRGGYCRHIGRCDELLSGLSEKCTRHALTMSIFVTVFNPMCFPLEMVEIEILDMGWQTLSDIASIKNRFLGRFRFGSNAHSDCGGFDSMCKASGRFVSATQQVKQVPHCQYRSLGAVGVADTSIFQPSLQGKLWKLGLYDSFMVRHTYFVLHRLCHSRAWYIVVHPRTLKAPFLFRVA